MFLRPLLLAALLVTGSSSLAQAQRVSLQGAIQSIREREMRAHVAYLAHDALEGRAPGTRGGAAAAQYIATRFLGAGLEPVRGSFFQTVPLVGTTADPERSRLEAVVAERRLPARLRTDAVVWAGVPDTAIALEAELVFVGFGIRAPEQRWDDFKGADLSGKVLLVLVGDPPAPPEEPALFGGRAMTYYGRWSHKVEEAERQGAAGVVLVHTAESAGYDWSVVQSSWGDEQLSLPRRSGGPPPLLLESWATEDYVRRILSAAGHDLDELRARAARRDFRPVATGITVRAGVAGTVRRFEAANVVGLVPGSDPERRGEVVVYTAHYDHLGVGAAVDGDSVYNGAYDNASGVAALLEIAGAFARAEPAPERSVLFIATTAEEAGLLGATHYVEHPLFPLARTVAVLNLDGANLWGETRDIGALGLERSTLGRFLEARAREAGLRLFGDRAPELGYFFRSDHFPFARAGVPAISLEHGTDFRDPPQGRGIAALEDYGLSRYHRPSDEYAPSFRFDGAVQQARIAFLVGHDLARTDARPEWYPGVEFRAARERMLRAGPR